MIALFDNFALFHDQNGGGILYGGQTVRHNKAGSAFHDVLECRLHF